MGLTASEFKQRVKDSNLPIGLVLMEIFEDEVKPEDFPNAFDEQGNPRLKHNVNAPKLYQTWCPHHDDQENGDSYTVYTESKSIHCYNGECILNKVSLSMIDCVSVYVFKMDPAQLSNLEISKSYFWKSARWLVENYGEILDISMSEIENDPTSAMSDEKYKEVVKNRIRKATVEYYNWLMHNTDKGKEAKKYLWETRALKYGTVATVEEIVDEFMLGVAYSNYSNPRLFNYLMKKGFKQEDIVESKVCNDYDGKIVDTFKSRFTYVTFPTIYRGRYGTIAGRNIDQNCDDSDRHYKLHGSTELPAGMDSLLDAEKFAIVEGEMDKVSVRVMGFKHVMESRGTNGLKPEYIQYIADIRERNPDKCRQCYLIYDPDGPGMAAAEKTGQKLVDIGVEVLVVRLPKVEKVKNGVKKMSYLDPNDLLRTYKEKAVETFEQYISQAISYDAFRVLYELEKSNLSTKSAARMAVRRSRKFIDNIAKDERMFIMEEVLEHLEESGIPRERLESSLKIAWLGEAPEEEREANPGFEEASQHSWLLATDDEQMFRIWKHQLKLPNAVHVLNAEDFVRNVQQSSIAKNITFDQKMNQETGRYLWNELKSYNLTIFTHPETFKDFDRSQVAFHIRTVNRAG